MKTAREAMEYIKQSSQNVGGGSLLIPLMVEFLVKHFESGKGIDDILEMD